MPKETYLERIQLFFKTPRVKFFYESFFFACFLLLLSYTVLCEVVFTETNENQLEQLNKTEEINKTVELTAKKKKKNFYYENVIKPIYDNQQISTCEKLLLTWVFFIFLEELIQVKKIRNYLKNI